MSARDEAAVICRIVAGDTAAYRSLVEKYEARLFRVVVGYVVDRHEAEDIAQEVFLAAFRRLASYDASRSAFFTWLAVIARNRCLNRLRRRSPKPLPLDDLPGGSTPDEVAASKEVFLAFDEALRQLPVEQRSAFVLAEVEGVTYERIAEIEGAPLGTVKSRIARAREKLRQTLQVVVSDSDHD